MSEQTPDPETTGAVGVGLATVTTNGTVLDTWFPNPRLTDAVAEPGTVRLSAEEAAESLGSEVTALLGADEARGVEVVAVRTSLATLATAPADAHDVYLRLHLLSHRLVAPHGQNLDGLFAVLPNVVWTDRGPCAVEDFEATRLRLRAATGQDS